MTNLLMMDATALSVAIRTKGISSVELMQATLAHIARLNPQVNAIIDLRDGDELLAEAAPETTTSRAATIAARSMAFRRRSKTSSQSKVCA